MLKLHFDDLLSPMPRAVDLLWSRGSGRLSATSRGALPVPLLHFALPLGDMEAARAFLRDRGKHVACYRLDPREEGKLMLGMFDDGEAKTIAREELKMEVPERFVRSARLKGTPAVRPLARLCNAGI